MTRPTESQIAEIAAGYQALIDNPAQLTPYELHDIKTIYGPFGQAEDVGYKIARASLDWYVKRSKMPRKPLTQTQFDASYQEICEHVARQDCEHAARQNVAKTRLMTS